MPSTETPTPRGCFARRLAAYDREAAVQHFMAEHLVSLLEKHAAGRSFGRVLDLGCGTGGLARALLKRFSCRELQLFDLAPGCASFLHDLGVPWTFCTADLDDDDELPAADAVISGACLQWLAGPEALFRRIARALPAGGLFAASTFVSGNLEELAQAGGAPLASPTADFWEGALAAAGFHPLVLEESVRRVAFPSSLAMLRHLRDTGVLFPVMKDPGAARRFLRRFEDRQRENGELRLTYRPVFWVAAKKTRRERFRRTPLAGT